MRKILASESFPAVTLIFFMEEGWKDQYYFFLPISICLLMLILLVVFGGRVRNMGGLSQKYQQKIKPEDDRDDTET